MDGYSFAAIAPHAGQLHAEIRQASPARDRGETLRLRRLERLSAYVDAMILDPALSARNAARGIGVSVRSLHTVLAASGDTFTTLVQRRRLEACYRLLRRSDESRSVADIAFACGFNSLSSFYRAFRRHLGGRPRMLSAR